MGNWSTYWRRGKEPMEVGYEVTGQLTSRCPSQPDVTASDHSLPSMDGKLGRV